MDVVEQVLRYDVGKSRILILHRLVEPLEGLVGIATIKNLEEPPTVPQRETGTDDFLRVLPSHSDSGGLFQLSSISRCFSVWHAPPPLNSFFIGKLTSDGGDKVKLLTLRQLEQLTGKHRKFLNQLLEGIPFQRGANRAHLYESTRALPAIYAAGANSLEGARIRQAEASARLNELRAEVISKTRIPIDLIVSVFEQSLQAMVSTLKAFKGKELTIERINEILDKFRVIPEKLKW